MVSFPQQRQKFFLFCFLFNVDAKKMTTLTTIIQTGCGPTLRGVAQRVSGVKMVLNQWTEHAVAPPSEETKSLRDANLKV